MNTENQRMLNDVTSALNSEDSIFIGLVGENGIDSIDFMSNLKDQDMIIALLIEACLKAMFRQKEIDGLFNLNSKDVSSFASDVIKSSNKVIRKKLDELGKSVDKGKTVNFLNVDAKNRSATIAFDMSNLEKLKSDPFFKSMPDVLKNKILNEFGGGTDE